MYFEELPYKIDANNTNIISKKLYKSESKDFDELVKKLLQIDVNFIWDEYIHCDFLRRINSEKKFMYLYEIEKITTRIDLRSNKLSLDYLYL